MLQIFYRQFIPVDFKDCNKIPPPFLDGGVQNESGNFTIDAVKNKFLFI